MKISQLGELEFITRIRHQCSVSAASVLGIGDDCAIFPCQTEHEDGLITTDLLIESVHFSTGTGMWELGHKALEVNISDIAAMGGTPLYATISVAVHADIPVIDMQAFYRGLIDTAHRHEITIVGGDTSQSPGPLFISITILGRVEKGRALLRSGAQAGDLIGLTGTLGDSFVGHKWLLSGLKDQDLTSDSSPEFLEAIKFCTERHCYPRARVKAGRALQSSGKCHACIDLSDGLATDLRHIVCESNVGAEIDLDLIPIDIRTERLARVLALDPMLAATTGGEDYELLFMIPPEAKKEMMKLLSGLGETITFIGRITSDKENIAFHKSGQPFDFNLSGYEHFSRP
ncbi:thiamine-phosphate kinase [candidate division CSSED10-310 bacterium]|uniref:Thiamine-monophosphate kinase n=1 Tax=candidate division CSSED10-310 bacterium TaxID=2855610 RepID=A0ABV6Z304_UNCC1